MSAPPPYPPDLLARIVADAERDPGHERCGLVLRRPGPGGPVLEAVPVANVADDWHARDPARHPRTSRESYLMDPRALLRIHEDLAATGGEIVAAWHSHIEVGAYFSAKDHDDALVDGSPVLPGAEYLVVGVKRGCATEVKRFVLEGPSFLEHPLPE